tara:strand:- start:9123 stop:9578 length:456 start_codon:yes stop_codon:yes gene_type:complete
MSNSLSQIINITASELSHDLWVSIIDEVAQLLVAKQTKEKHFSTEKLNGKAHDLLMDMAREAEPSGDELLSIIGESDYFLNLLNDLSWSEFFHFTGDPCEFSHEVVNGIKNCGYYQNAAEYMTEDQVKTLFTDWKIRFIDLILNEVKLLQV